MTDINLRTETYCAHACLAVKMSYQGVMSSCEGEWKWNWSYL